MIDIWAKIFYMIAMLPFVQSYYIHKYDMHCITEDECECIYSGNQLVEVTGVGAMSWKHRAGMLGLSQNRLVVYLLTEK